MLNLTQMFSMQPLPVYGGRFVPGYAMSGSKEKTCLTEEAIEANPCHRQKAENEKAVLEAMEPGFAYTLNQLEKESGVKRTSLRSALERLIDAEKVKRFKGKVAFYTLA